LAVTEFDVVAIWVVFVVDVIVAAVVATAGVVDMVFVVCCCCRHHRCGHHRYCCRRRALSITNTSNAIARWLKPCRLKQQKHISSINSSIAA
jgi:hypothetical protein